MKINRINYEAYFLDYIDGTLSTADKAELEAFLVANPDLKALLENYEAVTLPVAHHVFLEKEILKKDITNILNINDSNFEELCIARIEGDMDKDTEALFEKYLNQNPDKLKVYKVYLKTILEPDKTIVFEDKRKLKHLKIARYTTTLYISIAAAASIAILLAVYLFQNNSLIHTQIASLPIRVPVSEITKVTKSEMAGSTKTRKNEKHVDQFQKAYLKDTTAKIIDDHIRAEIPILLPQPGKEAKSIQASFEPEIPSLANINLTGRNVIRKNTIANKEKYLTLNELAKEEMLKVIESQKIVDKDGIDFWAIAKNGLAQINKITGANIEMNKVQDSTKNRTRIEFSSGLLGYYTSKNDE